MIEADPIPPVDDDELLARFLVNKNEFRPSDNTVKPKAFLPHKLVDLSVNRHRDCSEDEIWQFGQEVATLRKCKLYDRTDIHATKCRTDPLEVEAHPLSKPKDPIDNPNHANVTGYPAKKEDQMSLAQKLAAEARRRLLPPGDA